MSSRSFRMGRRQDCTRRAKAGQRKLRFFLDAICHHKLAITEVDIYRGTVESATPQTSLVDNAPCTQLVERDNVACRAGAGRPMPRRAGLDLGKTATCERWTLFTWAIRRADADKRVGRVA